jgi:hypothetical protein
MLICSLHKKNNDGFFFVSKRSKLLISLTNENRVLSCNKNKGETKGRKETILGKASPGLGARRLGEQKKPRPKIKTKKTRTETKMNIILVFGHVFGPANWETELGSVSLVLAAGRPNKSYRPKY